MGEYTFSFVLELDLILQQVPYPLISLVSKLPQTLHGQCPLTFHTRTFETFSLSFSNDGDAVDVFESVKELTVARKQRPNSGRIVLTPLIPSIRHTPLCIFLST